MGTFLFDEIIFGPIKSRRLGSSLGINLLPTTRKVCSFNCIYCECGWTELSDLKQRKLVTSIDYKNLLESKLIQLSEEGVSIDTITFAGNGEPTMHPEFERIIDITIELRNKYFENTKISVLTNATMIHKESVHNALLKIENAILKLDAGNERMFNIINGPKGAVNFNQTFANIKNFKGVKRIQTMFLRGEIDGELFDNTTDFEVATWIERLKEIKPNEIMIYPIERDTPAKNLQRITVDELKKIAVKLEFFNISILVVG